MKYSMITIGSAVQDTMFPIEQAELIQQKRPMKRTMMAFEYGAKHTIQDVFITTGGGACNTAIDARKLGETPAVMGIVGQDSAGQHIIEHLKQANIGTQYITRSKKGYTAFSTIIAKPAKENREHVIFHHQGVAQHFNFKYADLLAARPEIVYLCSLRTEKWATMVKKVQRYKKSQAKAGRRVIWAWNPGNLQICDLAVNQELLAGLDIILLNRKEARELVCARHKIYKNKDIPDLLRKVHEFGPQIVVITDGKHGAYAYDGEVEYYVPKYTGVPTLDTTGVGDAFGSTFTVAYKKTHGDIGQAMQIAAINAAHVASVVGAQNGALSWRKIQQILKTLS
jgi:fructokinase